MKEFFGELFEYNFKMNEGVLVLLNSNTWHDPAPLFRLISHILAAHHIWNQRILKQPSQFVVWPEIPAENLLFLNQQNSLQSQSLLTDLPLNLSIDYTNSKGDAFTNSVQDMLYHVINHSNYHRAQIATEVRKQGGTPLTTDYIFYKRG